MVVLESASTDPCRNLALEEYLCRLCALDGGDFFMLWRNEPSVIIGRFQDAASEVNAAFTSARHIPVVRRNSGGGAVYHDLGNVNYSFIVPDRRERGFAFFADKIITALAEAGVAAEFSVRRNDILVGGRKVSGMAQYCHERTLLCHGTLLFDCGLDVLAQALNVPDEKLRRHGVKSVLGRVSNLKPLLPRMADAREFMDFLWRTLAKGGIPFVLSTQDEEEVQRLMREKYSNTAWNDGIRRDE